MARKDNKGRNLKTGEQQRKDGVYLYRYTDNVSGKRQTIYAGDLPELRMKKEQLEKDLQDNILTDLSVKKLTLNELFKRYMNTRELAESTQTHYWRMWNNRVRDELGYFKVTQIRVSHIKAFYSKLSKAGYSHNTIKYLHTMIFPAFELAVEDDIIRKNPAKHALTKIYGAEAKEKVVLTVEQQKRLFDFINQSKTYNLYTPMFTIMLEVAIRCGELIGITWDDVDISNKVLSVNHQLIYKDYGDGYKFHISTPKTGAGVRNIPLTDKATKAFIEQKKINFMLGRKCDETIDGYDNFVFIAKTGRPLMPSAVNNVIYNIINSYNKEESIKAKKEKRNAQLLPKISVHNFRHTACTNMARSEMNVKALQYIMGHARSDITMDVYNHLNDLSDIKKEIARYESYNALNKKGTVKVQ